MTRKRDVAENDEVFVADNELVMTRAHEIIAANRSDFGGRVELVGDPNEIMKRVAIGVFQGCASAFLHAVRPINANVPTNNLLQLADPDPQPDVMTADEVAEYLGVDRNTVYEYAARGMIPHKRLGKRVLFRRGSIIAWFDNAIVDGDR